MINEVRAERIMELPLDFIDNPRFSRKGADNAMPGRDAREPTRPTRKPRRPSGLPPYLASLYEMPLLTREQEQHLFRKYNYLKYKAAKLRKELDVEQPKAPLMDEIEELYEEIVATKNQIARANLRLVVSIAKRHVTPDQNFFELVSDGNVSLLRAIEKFDYARGNKFSTYASLGDHEELCPDDPRRVPPTRPLPHELRRAVRRHARKPRQPDGRRAGPERSAGEDPADPAASSTSANSRSSSAGSASITTASRSPSRRWAPRWA